MANCPYCKAPIKQEPEHIPMSLKRRAIYDCIKASGPEGLLVEALKERFFPTSKDNTIRTTLHYINRMIAPARQGRIVRKGGIIRLVPRD